MRIGDTGDAVIKLQLMLVQAGYLSGEPSGLYDETTAKAVAKWQGVSGKLQTGVVDEKTSAEIASAVVETPDATKARIAAENAKATAVALATGPAGPGTGMLLGVGLLMGGLYYWNAKRGQKATDGYNDEEEDDYEDEEDDEGPPMKRQPRLADATTDSLLDEPAAIAGRGRAGDCKKAGLLLLRRRFLAKTERERNQFNKVARKVVDDCAGRPHELEAAREEAIEQVTDAAADLVADLPKGSKLYESGFRKTKRSTLNKTTVEHGDARSKGRKKSGRPGAAAVGVRKKDGSKFKLRKEKNSTKRGYSWRKEED